ncbi:MAG: TIGR01212 family radical SAM protein [Bacteroidia bacterium]|nr:TIGR01212 family radical SAM protein [Bacteroidia bacterium]
MRFHGDRRFNSYVGHLKWKYGGRLQKIVVDAGFTCPNRDGSKATGGCTYCDNNAFHPSYSTASKPILQQLNEGIGFHKVRYRNAGKYLAYFQSYSNTYGTLEKMKEVYREALSHPEVAGLVIGTRPDCIDNEKLEYIGNLSKEKIVVIEYGIESVYDKTLERINRAHDFATSRQAVHMTAKEGIFQGAHFIFGLPGESREEMLGYAGYINDLPLDSLKFHQLQIVKGTRMEKEFETNPGDFYTWTLEEYIDFFIDFLELLRPDLLIERFAGEVPPRFVNTTPWGLVRNVEMIRMLEKRLEQRDTFQSRLYQP